MVICAMAQATSLLVDNQTPGWLSSKINYGDQQTLVNLKVTGFINKDDLSFIGDLSTDKQLQGVLDLSDANFVGMGYGEEDNEYYEKGSIKGKYAHFIFPKSLKKVTGAFEKATADTITIGGTAMPNISPNCFYYTSIVKHLILREGVDSLTRKGEVGKGDRFFSYSKSLVSLSLPSTLKYVDTTLPSEAYFGSYAPGLFSNLTKLVKVNLPDSIEYLQDRMFINVPAFKDTVRLPKKLKEFYPTTFGTSSTTVPDNQVVYIPDSVSIIHFVAPNNYWECHVKREEPLPINKYTGESYKKIHVYVPKSALTLYQKSNWNAFTLHAEPNPAVGISIDKDSLKLHKGNTGRLSVTIIPDNADYQKINWFSANAAIANVDTNGVVKAVSTGSTYVYASIVDNTQLIDSCLIIAFQPVTGLQLNNSEKEIKVGDSFILTASISPYDADDKSVIWKSDKDSVATVVDGKVTGEKAGTVKIIATSASNNDISATCEVTVLQPVKGIQLDNNSFTLNEIGDTIQLFATVLPDDASNKTVNWRSNDEKVCIVSNGKVVAVGYGTAVIIATTVDGGYMATCTVKVEASTSVIENIVTTQAGNYEIYDVTGKRLNSLHRGINIIKSQTGKVRKKVIM